MTFTVLSDDNVRQLLSELSPSDTRQFITALQGGLVAYSCQDEQQYQPERSVISRPSGQRSLFMPATTPQAIGVKMVGIAPPSGPTSAASEAAPPPPPALRSVLTLCNAAGEAIGILNAAELTAFRTALGSMLLYQSRKETANIVVFGSGKQAQWHIRLAVMLRAKDIRKIVIVNRSRGRAQALIASLVKDSHLSWPSHIKTYQFEERNESLEDLVADADVIFCTTPATEPLFRAKFLTSASAQRKTRYIAAIGSYRLNMAEIDPELIKIMVDPFGIFSQHVWQRHIAVDTREGCLQEAGELVSAGVDPGKMLEVGRIFGSQDIPSAQTEWLEEGFVLYKSVGVGVMDMAVGHQLLQLAKAKDIGTTLATF
ncbi:ornithine cyclodeaminase [Cordyceps fumosorosea ARSEF 2679]|uniref:Ornithine cyclodeaminase n=1 Tax=Cordyceps fumosorosea (strain ARSEF 2679) TaxID=1081104 RepID=A0A166XVL4_CORFA|nr:ornithine cyclodeaminase [Cordyceps fumosorosea ARSEF 2679]OAA36231.1 ornithine cyclodeaminase [Cordyceps fumosorosea ARSEF 2679]